MRGVLAPAATVALALVLSGLSVGCAAGAKTTRGASRAAPSAGSAAGSGGASGLAVDLTGNFSTADGARAASALSRALGASRWLAGVSGKLGRPLRLARGPLRNRTGELVNSNALAKRVGAALARSPKVEVAAASASARADAVLIGWLLAAGDRAGQRELRDVTLVLRAIVVPTGELGWQGVYRQRKLVVRAKGKAKVKVERLDSKRSVRLSGAFTGADAARLADAAARELRPALGKLRAAGVKVISIHPLANRTPLRINTALQEALLAARILALGPSAPRVLAHDRYTARKLAAWAPQRELAADAVLGGYLYSSEVATKAGHRRTYTLALTLTGVRDRKRHWVATVRVHKVLAGQAP